MEDKMTSKEITELINRIWEGVENSIAGKIFEKKEGEGKLHHVGFNAFIIILTALCPRSDIKVETSGELGIKEPKEKWQE